MVETWRGDQGTWSIIWHHLAIDSVFFCAKKKECSHVFTQEKLSVFEVFPKSFE